MTKTEKILEAYKAAFNQIDDLMEYRGMTKEQFTSIADGLNVCLIKIQTENET